MFITLGISLLVISVFIASILFLPSLVIRKHTIKVYSIIPMIGALLLIIFERVDFFDVIKRFSENTAVNPIKILILFLSMTIFSLVLEQTGFFSYISTRVLQKAGKNQFVVFISLYLVISLLTVFTSNDIIILTFTPFICHFCRAAKIRPLPYLIMEFVAANTWSLLLIIGNPTNIYICGAFGVDFVEYITVMALPTLAAGLTSLGIMLLLFGKCLKKKMGECDEHGEISDRPVMAISLIHLFAVILGLAISGYIGIEMWVISLALSISEVVTVSVCLAVRRKGLNITKRAVGGMPFEVIPFIMGMFVMVMALEDSGITHLIEKTLEPLPDIFTYGYLSFLSSNIVNNIPMSVFFSKILSSCTTTHINAVYATVIGSNIGAFLTPVGALAGIMWSNLLKKNRIRISFKRFVKYGVIIGVPTMTASLLTLYLIFR